MWSKELIILPVWAFFKLASNLPDPGTLGKDVIMLFNTARFGVFLAKFLDIFTQWARKFKKVQAKKTREIK